MTSHTPTGASRHYVLAAGGTGGHLIPADPSFNSRKNDRLPRMGDYFDGYYLLQKTAIEVMTGNYPNEPMMEDYLNVSYGS